MRGILISIITVAAFTIIEHVFGRSASTWTAVVVLAFALGLFWGAGKDAGEREGAE